ncbi:MAG: NAD-glutamate dehydrogenase [Gammaproteobacteria bacterium]|nr:NAD-glutamate dehydrogenase [Gammaproteobacteria bacterium]MDH4311087.1 NAD-glutamate dehydrogenase [Gammaproteobacteria bacterium]MDH5273521.1 NAD-glutamate dehydrogenase [Gammaproteobacteria bacterium]
MPGTIPAARQHLIDDIAKFARKARGVPLPLPAFVQAYYRGVGEEDLRLRDAAAFAASAAGHLGFGTVRRAGEPKVRVFNPQLPRDGWESPHTIVEVVTEDMPFLVDSLAVVLGDSRLPIQLMIHPVLRITRDRHGRLQRMEEREGAPGTMESWQHVAVPRIGDPARHEALRLNILRMLDDVRLAVSDWPAIRQRALDIAREVNAGVPAIPRREGKEAVEFLEWLVDNHFTFLGYREYRLERERSMDLLVPVPRSGLGLLRTGAGRPQPKPTVLTGELRRKAREVALLIVTKANSVATVHRATYLDYVGIKTFDKSGRVIGERRFIGLFTSSTYSTSPREIPLLRHKVQRVVAHIGVSPTSHDGKALMQVLETFPRDELFQATVPELVRTTRGIVNMYERQRVRLFARRDPYRRFFSCLLYVPRDHYNTQVRERIERILLEELAGVDLESQVQISESALARLHILVRTDPVRSVAADVERIEQRITAAMRTWTDHLRDELQARLPPEMADQLAGRFEDSFPVAYEEDVAPAEAIRDLQELAALDAGPAALGMELRPGDPDSGALHLRLYRRGEPVAMSDILPLLENFDLRILNERPYRVAPTDGSTLWIQDIEVKHAGGRTLDPELEGRRFEQAFFAVHHGQAESDGFNRLVLAAGLDWQQALILRAVCRYLLQTGIPFSQRYMEAVLARNPSIAARLAWTFESRFDPELKPATRAAQVRAFAEDIDDALEKVTSPDDDRILRAFRAVIMATLRTNHYQRAADGKPKPYLSLKLDPKLLPELPKPRPMFEIWVYSPRVEGVHLRMGKVARGGLRWSDRREDFRTEVLGLMKAQNVKNTLIVPVGAKGGFVPKQMPAGATREDVQREGTECYRTFIRALLDITDNVRGDAVIPPERTVRYDADDPYLVVAADKGTATFSDTANALSAEYGFWLGDAFASGGSAGYDHKKMGITAKGAWECVKRHFRELDIDTQSQDFTVAGIGDMAGDVFGNGLLLSPHIRLVAAFNHQHIFLDPEPDAARSFKERERLFNLPRSSWTDYDAKLISRGGGVFPRNAKEIALSPQARLLLGIDAPKATPAEIIRLILKLPVDLLWNGGIGTYVKASWEANSAVGDRTNDGVRVDGRELRCKVVGEGGNLGFSQLGRIEYALRGGRMNTDFVDNSGGVDCSDHEVNIKILLKTVQERTRLTTPQRNRLLESMTDDVGQLVLRDNYLQSQAISLLQASAPDRLGEHAHFIRSLELDGVLDRALEYLPSAEEIEDRRRAGLGLVRPEIAMLLSYAKIALSAQLIQSNVPEDPYLSQELDRYFPPRLAQRYGKLLDEHRLKREIIVTATTNSIVNRMGPTFVARTQQDTGADAATVARAYSIAREVFEVRELWTAIERLDNRAATTLQYGMMHDTIGLIRQATYWLIQRHRSDLGIDQQVARLRPGIQELTRAPLQWLDGAARASFEARHAGLVQAGVPADLSRRIAACNALHSGPDIVELAGSRKLSVAAAAKAYFAIGGYFRLDWLRTHIEGLDTEGHWHAVARGSLREALFEVHRSLAQGVLESSREKDPVRSLDRWLVRNKAAAEHARAVVNDIRAQTSEIDFASLSVALQAVRRVATAEA